MHPNIVDFYPTYGDLRKKQLCLLLECLLGPFICQGAGDDRRSVLLPSVTLQMPWGVELPSVTPLASDFPQDFNVIHGVPLGVSREPFCNDPFAVVSQITRRLVY